MRNQVELDEFKSRMSELHKVLDQLLSVWDFEAYKILSVLVQNLASNGKHCVGYSFDKEVEKVYNIIKSLRLFSNYRGGHCYLSTFVLDEIEGLLMSFDI